ncbi:hypothetical protein BN1723_019486, partial [Verticillium longisporum]
DPSPRLSRRHGRQDPDPRHCGAGCARHRGGGVSLRQHLVHDGQHPRVPRQQDDHFRGQEVYSDGPLALPFSLHPRH